MNSLRFVRLAIVLGSLAVGSALPAQSIEQSPPHRRHHAITYDPATKRVLVYGGQHLVSNSEAPMLADLWAWDGKHWEQLSENTGVATLAHKVFADGNGGVFLVDGLRGVTSRMISGRWEAMVDDSSMRREMAAAAYDSDRRQLVV